MWLMRGWRCATNSHVHDRRWASSLAADQRAGDAMHRNMASPSGRSAVAFVGDLQAGHCKSRLIVCSNTGVQTCLDEKA